MKSSIEKQKAFVNTFQGPLSGMGFFVKNHVFYKCSKANRYMLSVAMELSSAGTLLRINIGFGSNYAPIMPGYKSVYGTGNVDAVSYLECSKAHIWDESGRFVIRNDMDVIRQESGVFSIRNDVQGLVDHVEYILPRFMDTFGPILSSVNLLSSYLVAEEALVEKVFEKHERVRGGAMQATILGYLSLGDFENAKRIADKLAEFNRNRLARYKWQKEEDPEYKISDIEDSYKETLRIAPPMSNEAQISLREALETSFINRHKYLQENIQRANKDIESATALRERIEAGAVANLMAEIALRDARSIETCTRFFGERRYAAS